MVGFYSAGDSIYLFMVKKKGKETNDETYHKKVLETFALSVNYVPSVNLAYRRASTVNFA
jgi:hypothetical protein